MNCTVLAFAGVLALSGCAGTPEKVAAFAVKVQPALIPACNTAMALSSVASPYAAFILAGCGGAEAIDKLAADPSSTAWVNGLIAKVEKLRS